MDWTSIIVAVITAISAGVGVYFSNRKSASLIEYRIGKLEEKVSKHNSVIERTYRLEESTALQDAELKRINKRLEIIEQEERKTS